MLAALSSQNLKWVKWLFIAAVCAAMVSMWLMLKASKAEQVALRARLDAALAANKTNQATIEVLTKENSNINQLLVKRTRQNSQLEGQLNADIEALRRQLEEDECFQRPWPDDVTDRLRQPY